MDTLIYAQSEYNLLSNSIHLDLLVKNSYEYGYKCIALADPNLYGAYKFITLCNKFNIKPILGLEFNIIHNEFKSKLLAFATNLNGYQELVKISSLDKIENKVFDLEELSNFKDLIFITTLDQSEILYSYLKSEDEFENIYNEYKKHLSNLYIGISLQNKNTKADSINLYNTCKKLNINTLPLHQTLYNDKEDNIVYESLTKISQVSYKTGDYFIPTINEYNNEFINLDFNSNLSNFVNKVDKYTIKVANSLPHFENSKGIPSKDYLRELCEKGLKKRFEIEHSSSFEKYTERLNYELSVISNMGYDDYFLIVWDYVKFAKKNKVMVGPGRGSACGSLVAYSLGITNVDPLKYDLLFERFLNPSRVTMPDIDMDFPDDKRAFVINYVKEKYGINRVCSISTFDTFQIKSSLRDLGKVLNISTQNLNIIVKEAASTKDYEALTLKYKDKDEIYTLLKVAKKIENLPRHISTHAAGIIISSEPLDKTVPLQNGINGLLQAQWDSHDLADVGLLKMDFLGIKNLQIIDNCCQKIGALNNINIQYIPLNDEKTYKLLQRGDTLAVFQLESSGMRNVLKKLRPTSLNDIVAVLALYRPGPMDQIDTYIERKNGKKFEYIHPSLEPILKSTYGIIVYQEQIMLIANQFAHMSLAEADLLRRAVSKKDEKSIEEQRKPFIEACKNNGYSQDIAEKLYSDIAKFAEYGFNKSHAVGYALLSYQMAYLKANYFDIYMSELLNSVIGNTSEIVKYINYAKTYKLHVYSPDINISTNKFEKYRDGLIMPLQSIKSIGNSLVNDILNERLENGDFKSLSDFNQRVKVSETNLKYLIYSSSFDSLEKSKKQCIDYINNGKGSFDMFLDDVLDKSVEEYEDYELKAFELEALGFNIKYDNFKNIEYLSKKYNTTYLSTKLLNRDINVIVEFREIKELKTKKNDLMCVGTLSDSRCELSFVIFPKSYEIFKTIINLESLFIINGKLVYDNNYSKYQIQINNMKLLTK